MDYNQLMYFLEPLQKKYMPNFYEARYTFRKNLSLSLK